MTWTTFLRKILSKVSAWNFSDILHEVARAWRLKIQQHRFWEKLCLEVFGSKWEILNFCEKSMKGTFLIFLNDVFFFYLGFLSRTFTNHRTAGEERGHFNSSLPLPPLHRHLEISRAITPESSPLHIASSQTRTENLWFPSATR